MKAICYELRGKCPLSFCQIQPCSVFVAFVQINEDTTRCFKAKCISEKMQSLFLRQCQILLTMCILFSNIKYENCLELIILKCIFLYGVHMAPLFIWWNVFENLFFFNDGKNCMDGNRIYKTTQFRLYGHYTLKKSRPEHIIAFYTS